MMEKRFALAVHGGAGPDSDHIKNNLEGYKKGLTDALEAGYKVLEKGGSAIEAVEAAVMKLEDDPLFNAGKGAALNERAEAEMCASIMDGKHQKSGAVAIVRNVKNPVALARSVMEKTKHIYIGGEGALDYAQQIKAPLEPDAYFITEHQFEAYEKERKKKDKSDQTAAKVQVENRMHGTVGAVALDQIGNLAAATSTGGTEHDKRGRIGDSSMVGVGCYADNNFCAVSTTGDGEAVMKKVTAFHLCSLMEYKGFDLEEAAEFFMKEKCHGDKQDVGFIAIDTNGSVVFKFNSERMHRGCKGSNGDMMVEIY
jgi:L-asparaginase / beta-aspartyl-peptidase